ncbi:YjgN family protein [Rhizobium sp. G187]|uniref:YjgN family protein n=1 Tax=unclassified Rhizobium TaxID=2613769 RepID=UPI0006B95EE3|nr:DUF898 family protein [Rhizobium sp. AAP43]KPF41622.1 hypothetical protein IP76_20455 [Rhizobium sp. AAP43]
MLQAATAPTGVLHRGEFRGNAKEYFGIWIVNILLTIVTLGIYSAWAKVRRNRYFYGNTFFDGHSFDYHAKGLQILIGRGIVIGYLAAYNIMLQFYPIAGILLGLLMLFALPWIVMRSLRFNARVTSYRNIRFDFVGKVGGAFFAIIVGSLVATFSLGILAPFASRWLYRYVFNNIRYGDRALESDPQIGALYRVWIPAFVLGLVGVAIAGLVGLASFASFEDGTMDEVQIIMAVYGVMIPFFVLFAIGTIFYRVGVRNVALSSTIFDGRHRLMSDMGRLRYFWIIISNFLVSMISFGLMRPWAAVRETRYAVEHTGIIVDGQFSDVIASIEASGSAVTAEYLDIEGFDFGF